MQPVHHDEVSRVGRALAHHFLQSEYAYGGVYDHEEKWKGASEWAALGDFL